MKINTYSYHYKNHPKFNNWITDEICLQQLNLIVGKNATGKSQIATVPSSFAEIITQNRPVPYGNQNFTFIGDNNKPLVYNFNLQEHNNITEKLSVDGQTLLDRSRDNTKIYSFSKKDFNTITPPDNKLVLHVRRDKEEYPYLEDIIKWAEQTFFFPFGKVHPEFNQNILNIHELGDSVKDNILKDFNKLNYDIENFYTQKENGQYVLYVKEKNLKSAISQSRLSQGMFRALLLIMYVYYLIENKKAKMIIIDDLGEGLDYERATRLGELIFNKFENSDVQLIASSNDSFLMDVVNIRYWSILVRKDNMVKVYNYRNSKDKFDSFGFSGLSNFDLFSSDYLD